MFFQIIQFTETKWPG